MYPIAELLGIAGAILGLVCTFAIWRKVRYERQHLESSDLAGKRLVKPAGFEDLKNALDATEDRWRR